MVREMADMRKMQICIPEPLPYSSWRAVRSLAQTALPIHVLLIEDNAEQATWVRLSLEHEPKSGYQVEWVPNLMRGMKRMTRPGIDVVLLDLGLPELSGYRTHTAIRLMAPKIPVVVLTADESDESHELAILDGAADYLVKGETSSAELREAVRLSYLANRYEW